ncbi:MAG: myo-inosose-2 dehydratase [Paracoccaceae bacterium]|nr:myo-inosose-2 dehydratase [Paracoccaceae bacterium]
MIAKLGIAPIAWSNDDLPELGGDTPLEICLAEARRAGFIGIETGGKFPGDARELGPILAAHDIGLCGGWYSGTLLDNDIEAEKDRIAGQMALFKALDAPCLVYGETAGTIQAERHTPLDRRLRLDEVQIRDYGHRLTAFAEWCSGEGMAIAFHHHMGAPIESERDLNLLMNHSGEALPLLYDPGHMAFAGGDVLRVIDKHGPRISHFHAKDIRARVISGLDRSKESFLDAVLKGAFTVPGDGSLDYGALVRRMADVGYEGWFVVEAEQDPAKAPPYEYACIGHAELTRVLTDAGYGITESPEG